MRKEWDTRGRANPAKSDALPPRGTGRAEAHPNTGYPKPPTEAREVGQWATTL